jgi:hypothetical protein
MAEQTAKAAAGLPLGLRALRPLQQVAISSSAADIRNARASGCGTKRRHRKSRSGAANATTHDRIRVHYVSADFRHTRSGY